MKHVRTLLFIHPSAELYGADQTLLQLVAALDAEHWRAVVLLPRRGVLAAKLEALGALVEVGELGLGERASLRPSGLLKLAWSVPLGALRVWRAIRRHRPSLVHCNTMIVLGGAIGARLSGVPQLWHVHEILERPLWLARIYSSLFALLARRIVCNSEATRASFARHSRAFGEKSVVILNGVGDSPQIRASERQEIRRGLGIESDQSVVLLPGRINSWKGQGVLVQAAQILRERFPRAVYLIVGTVPAGQDHFEETLRTQIESLGLKAQVKRIAFHPQLSDLYLAADICCVPSTRPEPFGLVAAEAMAAALPVVATDQGGLAEIVVDGETGTLIPACDASALAEALARLFEDPARARAMGAAGRQRQAAHFTLERYNREFEGHYSELAEQISSSHLPADTHIVHLSLGKVNPERLNGVNRAVHYLAKAQVEAGRPVTVWGLTPTPEVDPGERPYPLRLFKRNALRGLLPADLRRAIAQLRAPTIVHLHGGLLPEMASAARRLQRARIPFVFTPHGAYNPQALAKRPRLKRLCMALVDRAILKRAARVQAFTMAESRASARWTAFDRIAVVPNGQSLLSLVARARGETELLRFGFCGRLDVHTKGLDFLLAGFAQFLKGGSRSELVLIGDGPGRGQLEELIAEHGLGGQVVLAGALFGPEKERRLQQFDAFVHPSRHEGMPMAVLEAAALGLPLIVSEGTNLAPVVQAFAAGPELESSDAQGIAKCLQAFAQAQPETVADWGKNSFAMVSECFAWDRVEPLAARTLYGIESTPQGADLCAPVPPCSESPSAPRQVATARVPS